jgi:hypothetical protein
MPAPPDIPITITHSLTFLLPSPVERAIRYLSEPAILLGALPIVERAVLRQRGTYRLTLEPIRTFGHAIQPAAEVAIVATDGAVRIQSVTEEPNALQESEVSTQVDGILRLFATATGSDVRGTLRLAAAVPARAIPPLMPRMLAHRTAEKLLGLRLRQEMQAMARTLSAGFAAWDAEQQPVPCDR